MKKNLQKKLSFNKKTICNLNEQIMNQAKGGRVPSYYPGCPTVLTCDTCYPETCGCGGDTYETCNEMMCNTEYPFPC